MLETLKGTSFEYVVCEDKFPGNNSIIIFKNFKEMEIKLSFLLSKLMERNVCFLALKKQVCLHKK